MAGVEQIGESNDRAVARSVLSSLLSRIDPSNAGKAEETVVNAYSLLKQNNEAVTELRLKEIVSGMLKGDIPMQPASGGGGAIGGTLDRVQGNMVEENQRDLRYGGGVLPGPARQTGVPDSAQIDPNANFTDKALDFAGTLTWNFINSASVGLLGLAHEKVVKPLVGEDNGFIEFIDAAKRIDTSAGKAGEVTGTFASFVLPGAALGAAGKAGVAGASALGRANLLAHTFGAGRQAIRRATTAGIKKQASKGIKDAAGKAIDDTITVGEKGLKRLKAQRDSLKATSVKEATIGTTSPRSGGTVFTKNLDKVQKEFNAIDDQIKGISDEVTKLRALKGNEAAVSKIMTGGLKKSIDAAYDTKRTMSITQVEAATSTGIKDIVKGRFVEESYEKLVKELGDETVALGVLRRATKEIDHIFDDVAKGTRNWGEVFGSKLTIAKKFGDRIGKITQNFTEEAIGFAAHGLLFNSANALAVSDEVTKESIREAFAEGAHSVPHSIRTAFIFSTGGGIALPGVGMQYGILPMKLIFAGRERGVSEVLKHFTGKIGVNESLLSKALLGSAQKLGAIGRWRTPKQGVAGGGAGRGLWRRLRERGILDYERIGRESPETLAYIGKATDEVLRHSSAKSLPYAQKQSVSVIKNLVEKIRRQVVDGNVRTGTC